MGLMSCDHVDADVSVRSQTPAPAKGPVLGYDGAIPVTDIISGRVSIDAAALPATA